MMRILLPGRLLAGMLVVALAAAVAVEVFRFQAKVNAVRPL